MRAPCLANTWCRLDIRYRETPAREIPPEDKSTSTGSFSSRLKKTLPFHRTGLRSVKINNSRREILWFSNSVLEFLEKVESFIQKRYRQLFSGGKHTRFYNLDVIFIIYISQLVIYSSKMTSRRYFENFFVIVNSTSTI